MVELSPIPIPEEIDGSLKDMNSDPANRGAVCKGVIRGLELSLSMASSISSGRFEKKS